MLRPTSNPDQLLARSAYKKIDRRVLLFLAICYAVAYVDRVNIGFAKAQLHRDLALGDAAYGLGAGLFFLGYVLFEIPSNLLLVRFGARATITRILLLWGAASMTMSLVVGETSFYFARFVLGVCEAGFAPGAIYFLSRWYGPGDRARTLGLLLCAAPIGGAIAAPLSTVLLAVSDGWAGLPGWRWLFAIEGAPALLLGVLCLRTLAESPQDAHWLTPGEKSAVLEVATKPSTDLRTVALFVHWIHLLGDKRVAGLSAVYFFFIAGLYAVSFWLPTILQSAGPLDSFTANVVSAVPMIAAAASMYVFGRRSDRTGERRWHGAALGWIGAAALAGAVTLHAGAVLALIFMTVATACLFAAYSIFWSIPPESFDGADSAGAIAVINTIGLIGGFVSPSVIGGLRGATGSTAPGVLLIALGVGIGGVILIALGSRVARTG
ncbi:MFS transporter [Burkholderia gladioli]|uniref:MFS transporter n=1 Tax=Burkholderia gladioli TaxID=28095 RepID=UPI001C5D7556|nr:MFS transporter [Burkholderia gladioli]MBW5286731.1 MFS transporter [Burkholderia gladioli]